MPHLAPTTDPAWLGLADSARLIRQRQISSVELTQALLQRIDRLNPQLRAFARTTPDLALAQARAADQALARDITAQGQPPGLLHGVPLAVKDLCWTAGITTSAGMPIHAGFKPSQDGTVVRRLAQAGGVLLGKLQMTEGAFSAHHPAIAPPVNPWGADLWPGVSSSGSGVAVAAGLCAGAIGTDTGGSIRFPSAANAVTGLKPTWGRVSRFGAFELAASMDHLGPMCRSAEDCGLMLAAIAGPDPLDPTALQWPVPDNWLGERADASLRLDGLRIGIDEAYALADVDTPVADALLTMLRTLEGLGAVVVPVRFPRVQAEACVNDWVPLCGVEAAVAHADTFPSRRAEYGPMLADLLDTGRALSGLAMQAMWLRRADFTGRLNALLAGAPAAEAWVAAASRASTVARRSAGAEAASAAGVDLLIAPAIPLVAPGIQRIAQLRAEPGYRLRLSRYTAPFNLSGHPTLTLPTGFTADGLPLAGQLIAPHLREDLLLRAGRAFQQASDHHRRHPSLA